MKVLISYIILLGYLCAFEGLSFSHTKVKNGETVLVQYHSSVDVVASSLTIEKKIYPFFKHPTQAQSFYCLVPMAYNIILGKKSVFFSYKKSGKTHTQSLKSLDVIWGAYKKERLKVDPSKIQLSKKDEKRVAKEYYQAHKIYAKRTPHLKLNSFIQVPIVSKITSVFGNERLFNGTRKSYHSGTDYRATVGTEIYSMGAGKVVLVKHRFYAGNSVILDHGHGIFSGYYHLSKSHVKVGEEIISGEMIGESGATGRITGPHLHFSMKVHGVTVNPLQLMRLLESL